MIQITAAQQAAHDALDLPFDLDPATIAEMFGADGRLLPVNPAAKITLVAANDDECMKRARTLAEQAMAEMASFQPDQAAIAAFRAERQAEADAIRAASQAAHLERLAQSKAAAAERRAERQRAHLARIEQAKADAAARRALPKAA